MANYVKISLLSLSRIWQGMHNRCTGDYEQHTQDMIAYLKEELSNVLSDKPDLIVLPEACDRYHHFSMEERLAYYRCRGNRIRDYLRQVAKENHCYIAYSACREVPEDTELPYRNSTQIIGRDGEIVGIYDKNHLVPTELEKGKIRYGTEVPVFQLDFGRVACAICFDLNYDELLYRYAEQKPDLIIFSSMYHGGITQQNWAYTCRAYFAGAIYGNPSRILNPFGETVATSTNYYPFITGTVNMDYAVIHIDRNGPKYYAAKQKYGDKLIVHDPGFIGAVMLTYEDTDQTVMDIIKEFDMELLDEYFDYCRAHRNAHIEFG